MFLHVKYGHKERHTGTCTHTYTQGPSVEMPQTINYPTLQMRTLRQREATTYPKAGQKSQGPSSQLTAVRGAVGPLASQL